MLICRYSSCASTVLPCVVIDNQVKGYDSVGSAWIGIFQDELIVDLDGELETLRTGPRALRSVPLLAKVGELFQVMEEAGPRLISIVVYVKWPFTSLWRESATK